MISLRQMIGQGVSFFRFPNLPDVLSGPFMRYIPGSVYTFADNVYSKYLIKNGSIFFFKSEYSAPFAADIDSVSFA